MNIVKPMRLSTQDRYLIARLLSDNLCNNDYDYALMISLLNRVTRTLSKKYSKQLGGKEQ